MAKTYDQLQTDKEADINYRKRRHDQMTENYTLYRDKVITNRLTQRQTVNTPLMKSTINTRLSKYSKPTGLYFDELGNDKQKELFKNEYWRWFYGHNKLAVKERIDDLQVELYGRSFQKLNIVDKKPHIEIVDPMHVTVDRNTDPADLNTAHRITHTHIFRRLAQVEANANYDKDAVKRLRALYATRQGLVKAEDTYSRMNDANDRLRILGATDLENPHISDTIIELNEFHVLEYDGKEPVIYVYVTADGEILMRKRLKDILGVNEYMWTTSVAEPERTDFWSDGTADVVRGANQIQNVWLSQLVENRTMRSMGMHFFDSTLDGFAPQTFEPAAFGWYPVPGKPSDVMQRVEIPDLSESLDEIQYITGMVEQATAATAIEKGTGNDKQITLGEVQLLSAKAADRISGYAMLRDRNRTELGEKWSKLVDANPDKIEAVKLWKKSQSGNVYTVEVKPDDWRSVEGYACRVINEADKDEEAMNGLQKMFAARQLFAGNAEFDRLMKEKSLDIAGLTMEEKQAVMDADAQAMQMPGMMPGMPAPMPGMPAPMNTPVPPMMNA